MQEKLVNYNCLARTKNSISWHSWKTKNYEDVVVLYYFLSKSKRSISVALRKLPTLVAFWWGIVKASIFLWRKKKRKKMMCLWRGKRKKTEIVLTTTTTHRHIKVSTDVSERLHFWKEIMTGISEYRYRFTYLTNPNWLRGVVWNWAILQVYLKKAIFSNLLFKFFWRLHWDST